MHRNDKLASMLDESFHEFDRLMTLAIAEISEHAQLVRDHETLFARQQALQLAGASFVAEAGMALADLDGRNTLPRLARANRAA